MPSCSAKGPVSGPPWIHVRVSAGPRHPQAAELDFAIAVSDTGIGIGKSALERVFSPFQQAEASTSRQFGGTGLGLTISREIAAEMGGDLSVESTVGAGACFTLSLPLKISDAEIEGSPRREEESTIEGRVLVVEDNAINRRVLSELLTRRGLEVETAIDGLDGSRRATGHHEPEDAFDLIFMDMQMPVQDGYATTRELRAKGLTIPIIALTASAMAEDRRRCTDAGCNAHLAKPIDNVLLDELLSEYLGRLSPE
ncbi:response regulator [bacterium]|nr:response regulator [bacterium]